ncbi:DUF3617 domain-containing protein [Sphingomonas sp.]|uniref:DUF3617 domain-containing protein n=1 Tax=Sphingomonas sp. TaxID=28214 RepID=UPI003B003CAA
MLRPIAALVLLAAAAPSSAPVPGLWQVVSTPGTATLDGRPLADLPYTPSSPDEPRCLTSAMLHDPVALVVAQTPDGCEQTGRVRTRSGVRITGTCRPQAPGLARGSYTLDGRWTRDRYTVRFTTSNASENGTMGFSGTIAAKRVGDCPV